jgi:anti-sigma factor RsiW
LRRQAGRHIDSEELSILFPWSTEWDRADAPRPSVEALRDLHRHLASCHDCRQKLTAYRQTAGRLANAANPEIAAADPGCPQDVDWNALVGGMLPESKARQLISHAALCDHCGPLLRTATREATGQNSKEIAESERNIGSASIPPLRWQFLAWAAPLCSAVMILAVLVGAPLSSPTVLSARRYVEFAVRTHMAFKSGKLDLGLHSVSQQAVNDWLKQNAQFSVSLPGSPGAPDERQTYRLEGASLVQVGGRRAAFIAYQMDSGPASLMIAPYAVAVASGGVEAHFKKVTFHYRMVDGFKVVTWSQHGLTYALVSQEGPMTQKSCMVCHSAMRDRDLSNTPTPLTLEQNPIRSFLQ